MTLVLGYHHPLEIVKRYGTLDHVSSGRVILGLGVGSLKEEFDLLGAPFDDRGARADDALRALRAALSDQRTVLRRRVLLIRRADGGPLCAAAAHAVLDRRAHQTLTAAGGHARRWLVPVRCSGRHRREWLQSRDVPDGFEVVLPADRPLDPVGEPEGTQETLQTMAAGGTTILSAPLRPPLARALPRADPRAHRTAWAGIGGHGHETRGQIFPLRPLSQWRKPTYCVFTRLVRLRGFSDFCFWCFWRSGGPRAICHASRQG